MPSHIQQPSVTVSDILWMRRWDAVFFLFGRQNRSLWMFVRPSTWWDDVVLNSFGPCDWRYNFHIGKETFDYLCHKLQPLIEKQNTNMRRPVSVERCVAILL